MRKIKISPFILAIAATFVLSSCASVREKIPFMRAKDDGGGKAEKDGRIAVLGIDNEIKVDEVTKDIQVTIPDAIDVADWHLSGGNGANDLQNLKGDGKIGFLWARKIGSTGTAANGIIAPPIIDNNVIYTIDGNFSVHANDLASGKSIWSRHFAKSGKKGWFSHSFQAMGGGLAFNNGKLFLTSGFGEILALDAKNGQTIWTLGTNSPVHSAPMVAGGKVYAVSVDSVLWAVDENTGESAWTQSSLPESARVLSSPSSAISGETIVTPFASGEIIASLVSNGRKLWSEGLTRAGSGTSLSSINDIAGRPVIHSGVVYAGSQSGIVAAIDLRTGVKIWDKEIPTIQTPWVSGDFIFVVSTDSKVYCMKREDGSVVWIKQLDAYKNEKKRKNRIMWTGPVMLAGRLVLGSTEGVILELNPQDGNVLNSFKTKANFTITPAYKDGALYFMSIDGVMVAVK